MKVLISGASGLVGRAISDHLRACGAKVRALSRNSRESICWEPATGVLDTAALDQGGELDAVIHLAGENIASHRWTPAQKRRIRDSRVGPTEKLARSLASLRRPPNAVICASAVGYYGSRGDEVLTEASGPGSDFLSEVCAEWEKACEPLRAVGARLVHLRFGMILSANGGALAKMLPLFRAGLGGRLGPGTQWMSWIALEDVTRVVELCLKGNLQGPINTVSPNPVMNSEFTRILASTLHRPAIFAAPSFALRLAFGEMADALLLASQRALPQRLAEEGFTFKHPDLGGALRAVLKKNQ